MLQNNKRHDANKMMSEACTHELFVLTNYEKKNNFFIFYKNEEQKEWRNAQFRVLYNCGQFICKTLNDGKEKEIQSKWIIKKKRKNVIVD